MKATNHAYGHDYNDKHMANGGLRQSQQRVVDLDEENNLQRQTSSHRCGNPYPVTKIKLVTSSSTVIVNSRQ